MGWLKIGKTVFRFCNFKDLPLWDRHKGYKVQNSVWKRVPMSLIPSFLYRDKHFLKLDVPKCELEFLPMNSFTIEVNAEELNAHVYPCFYYVYDHSELEEFIRFRFVHIEPINLLHEFEVFIMEDLPIEKIDTVYTDNDKVAKFFEKHGITVKPYDRIDREEFREIVKKAIILQKKYNRSLKEKMPNENVVREVRSYNKTVFNWICKLGVPTVSLKEAIHVPTFKRMEEVLRRKMVLWG